MAEVFGALVPTFILIALGYLVRAARIATAEQFGMVNRFGYFVLYPAFLFTLVSGANFAGADALPFLGGVTIFTQAIRIFTDFVLYCVGNAPSDRHLYTPCGACARRILRTVRFTKLK